MGNSSSVRPGLSLKELRETAKTGDLVVLTKGEETHYGILLKDTEVRPRCPVLVAMASEPDEKGFYGVRLSLAIATIVYENYIATSFKPLSISVEASYQEAKSLASQTPRQLTANGVLVKVYASLGVRMTLSRCQSFPRYLPTQPAQMVVFEPMKPGPLQLLAKNEVAVPFHHDWIAHATSDRSQKQLEEILPTLNTGDIVLMCGVSVMRTSVRVGEGGNFNHVAIVMKDPLVGAPCIWESFDNKDVICLDAAKPTGSLTYVPFAARVNWGWDSPIAIRHLEISDERRKWMEKILVHVRCKQQDIEYEEDADTMEEITSAFEVLDLCTRNEDFSEGPEKIHCSELVAFVYQACGLLDRDRPPKKYMASDFVSSRKYPLQLRDGSLGKEIFINLKAVHSKND